MKKSKSIEQMKQEAEFASGFQYLSKEEASRILGGGEYEKGGYEESSDRGGSSEEYGRYGKVGTGGGGFW